jgi:hypothetical protein
MSLNLKISSHRFNYHLEKVRDIVNNACTNLLPIEEPDMDQSMETDEYSANAESSSTDSVEKEDKLMCEIVDEIPYK